MTADTNARLEQLESRLRRQQTLSVVGLLLAALSLVGLIWSRQCGAGVSGATVEANRFVLRDAKGNQRGLWEVDPNDYAAIRIAREGTNGAYLGESSEGPALTIFNSKSDSRILLQAHEDNAELQLTGKDGTSILGTHNGSYLVLDQGGIGLEAGANQFGPWLSMKKEDRERISLGLPPNQSQQWKLKFKNPDGTTAYEVPPTTSPP